jgi:Flp pilus assembly protein TadD
MDGHMRLAFAALGLLTALGAAHAQPAPRTALSVTGIEQMPARRSRPSAQDLSRLQETADKNPKLREAQFALTRGLMASGNLTRAHDVAAGWRQHDAYNLVVVRLLGDIETEQGDSARARRTYSSIVELLPRDVQARRALATVLKQAGDLQSARQQLLAALEIEPDRHTSFELGDVEYRLGLPEARGRFRAIAIRLVSAWRRSRLASGAKPPRVEMRRG